MDRIRRDQIEGAKKLVGDFFKDENESRKPPSPENMKKGARAALTAGTLLTATLAGDAEARQQSAGARQEQIKENVLSEHEMDLLAQNVYHEARGEPLQGQLAVTQVTLNRLVSGKFAKGKGLADGIIFSPLQFSWTSDPKVLMAKVDMEKLADIRAVISMYVGGKDVRKAVQALAQETGLPEETFFYKRTDWDEYDPDEKRMSEKGKKFFQSLTPVAAVGEHTFYMLSETPPKRQEARLERRR